MQPIRTFLLAAAVLAPALPVHAQVALAPPPQNVVQLSASAMVEVPQDLLAIQLQAVREGADPGKVQAELKAVLDAALAQARRDARPGALEVHTGNFTVVPRYGRDQKISTWVGSATMVLEGSDIVRVSEAAGRLPQLNVVGAAFRLSREKREAAEKDAQGQAIARFRAKAGDVARSFGFDGYGLREVAVTADEGGMPRPMMAMRAKEDAASAAVPVEAGKATVQVNVSGSVQLR